MKKIIYFLIIYFLILNQIALAQGNDAIFTSWEDILKFFDNLANIIGQFFWTAAVISAIWSGFLFLTAQGNEEKVGKAKKMFQYTVIAIIIGLLAFGLPSLIKNILVTVKGG
jgi:hypothetical protein